MSVFQMSTPSPPSRQSFRASRIVTLPPAALELIESGPRGLDAILEDVAATPGLPAMEHDGGAYDEAFYGCR